MLLNINLFLLISSHSKIMSGCNPYDVYKEFVNSLIFFFYTLINISTKHTLISTIIIAIYSVTCTLAMANNVI